MARRKQKHTGKFWAVLIVFGLVICAFSGGTHSTIQSGTAGTTAQTTTPTTSSVTPTNTSSTASENANTSSTATENTNSAAAETTGPSVPEGSNCTVTFLDVGQGDSALVECEGHWLLIDGGPSDASSKLYSICKQRGIDHFDAIIATHPDADHIGGISGAINASTTSVLYCSTDTGDTKTFKSMKKYADTTSGVSITMPTIGSSFQIGSAVITFVGPTSTFDDDNNSSLVCRLDYGSNSFLFEADAEEESEQSMLAHGADIQADVLKVAHHGSASSSSVSFLKAVSPRYAIVSVGENTYGHPTEQTLTRLENVGAQILRTDEHGDITFVSDGTTINVSSSK